MLFAWCRRKSGRAQGALLQATCRGSTTVIFAGVDLADAAQRRAVHVLHQRRRHRVGARGDRAHQVEHVGRVAATAASARRHSGRRGTPRARCRRHRCARPGRCRRPPRRSHCCAPPRLRFSTSSPPGSRSVTSASGMSMRASMLELDDQGVAFLQRSPRPRLAVGGEVAAAHVDLAVVRPAGPSAGCRPRRGWQTRWRRWSAAR